MDTNTMDDQSLLRQARELDKEAFSTIYNRYYDAIYRTIYRQVGHIETAEDLAAETFVRLVKHISEGNGPNRHLRAWLYRVARNLAVDELRKGMQHHDGPVPEDLPAHGEDVAAQAQNLLMQAQAREALGELTEKQRAVIELKYLEGMGNVEIARVLNVTSQNVKKLHQRGIAALRAHFQHREALSGGTV